MSSSAPIVSFNEARRWTEWQARNLDWDRRRAVALRCGLAIITIAFGDAFGIVS